MGEGFLRRLVICEAVVIGCYLFPARGVGYTYIKEHFGNKSTEAHAIPHTYPETMFQRAAARTIPPDSTLYLPTKSILTSEYKTR